MCQAPPYPSCSLEDLAMRTYDFSPCSDQPSRSGSPCSISPRAAQPWPRKKATRLLQHRTPGRGSPSRSAGGYAGFTSPDEISITAEPVHHDHRRRQDRQRPNASTSDERDILDPAFQAADQSRWTMCRSRASLARQLACSRSIQRSGESPRPRKPRRIALSMAHRPATMSPANPGQSAA